jgi:hypothetical protein
VVGVWRTGKADVPFELRYQMVELGEEFITPKDQQADHPVGKLMERYTEELKKGDYLGRYPQRTHEFQAGAAAGKEPTYVGSEACKKCHQHAYKVWKDSKHAHAYQTLEEAARPSRRQFDPECIVCHTVGFGFKSGFVDAEKTKQLKNVGCESCHGPGSAHVAVPGEAKWRTLMNPWKEPDKETAKEKAARELRIDLMCQKCHDSENDVKWKDHGFARKWPFVVHHTPEE